MKLLKAILLGALLWVLIFFEVSILMFGFGFKGTETIYYLIHYIALALFVIFISLIYFKDKKIKYSKLEGLFLGIIVMLISTILDALITVPLFIKDYSFFLKLEVIISTLLILILTTLIGMLKKQK